ncbi:hypothetical protein DU508_17525 [Pedobacter chinensis]|uniref:HTTM-like domain-containing protein n=1 Tax=Pedobacter chinensis TaxID=2282421 RepID=A0A369PS60_9SPHI|nr:HTTM domain-containing protein [Pedobacter chinensis]RDC55373.1 hypothetical protein DU508_17525 [Pedobacter chinensis]
MQNTLLSVKTSFLWSRDKFLAFQKEDGLFFPFFRIAIGLFCCTHLLAISRDFELLYTDSGLIPLKILSIQKVQYMPSYSYVQSILTYLGITSSSFALGYMILYGILCITLVFGFLTRFSSLTLLFLHILIFQSSTPYMYGVEFFKSIALFYCFIFPVGNKISVDSLIFKRSEINPTPYRNLLKIHMSIVYFTSGIDKSFGINWWNGESVWKAIHLPGFKSNIIDNYNLFAQYPSLPLLFGIGTIIIEVFYPLAMAFRKTRMLWLLLTISLHVGIILSLNLYFFGLLMILLNLAAFLTLKDDKHDV